MSRCLIGNLRGVDPLDCRAIHPHLACAEGGDSCDYVEFFVAGDLLWYPMKAILEV